MNAGDEETVRAGLEGILSRMAPGRFGCRVRKSAGGSVIGKPVDLEVYRIAPPSGAVIAVEVANVNTTQLVGETCRLYYDTCPLKLLVLGDRNVPANGGEQCELLLTRLYGQGRIEHTPARVVWYHDDPGIGRALSDLLLLSLARET